MRHGTLSGYRQHRREGTKACTLCRSAWAGYSSHLKLYGPRPKNGLPEVVLDVGETHHPVAMGELSTLVHDILPGALPESVRRTAYRLVDRGLIEQHEGRLVPA